MLPCSPTRNANIIPPSVPPRLFATILPLRSRSKAMSHHVMISGRVLFYNGFKNLLMLRVLPPPALNSKYLAHGFMSLKPLLASSSAHASEPKAMTRARMRGLSKQTGVGNAVRKCLGSCCCINNRCYSVQYFPIHHLPCDRFPKRTWC
jgi:hypothetical protein